MADGAEDAEVEAFLSTLQEKERGRYGASYGHGANRSKDAGLSPDAVLEPFDPNEADSLQLIRLGLPERVVRSILHYRAKGGVFRTVDSFSRIYTLRPRQYEALKPYIRIGAAYQSGAYGGASANVRRGGEELSAEARAARADSLRPLYPIKFKTDTLLDINSVDTTLLKRVPGIGSGLARSIDSRRRALGGFYSVEQLAEVPNSSPDWYHWFAVMTPPRRSIRINAWGVERLRQHPYVDFYQARKIVECRKKYGRITDLSRLEFYDEFTAEDLKRLEPYVDYR
jgi:DNA uptake protein ComE-like DNA-binding protein